MGWQGLSEIAPRLSEAEVQFEKRKQLVGLWLGPLLFLLTLIVPPLQEVTAVGMRTLGIATLGFYLATWVLE
jgi:hypothetical protein